MVIVLAEASLAFGQLKLNSRRGPPVSPRDG
jgi:hypothetical protein